MGSTLRLLLMGCLSLALVACTGDGDDDDDSSPPHTLNDGNYDASSAAILNNTCAPSYTAADVNGATVDVTATATSVSWDTPATEVLVNATRSGNSLSDNETIVLDFNEFQIDCVLTIDVHISGIVTNDGTIRVSSDVETLTDATGADCTALLAEIGNPPLPCEIDYTYTLTFADPLPPTARP